MSSNRAHVSIVGGPKASSDELNAQLRSLVNRCESVLTNRPGEATFLVGLGEVNLNGKKVPSPEGPQLTFVWFEEVAEAEIYTKIIDTFGRVRFFHATQGLFELEEILEEAGVLESEHKADPLAEDALFRLKGEYLNRIEQAFERESAETKRNRRAGSEQWQQLVRQIVGSAGSYEFEALSRTAAEVLSAYEKKKPLPSAEAALQKRLQGTLQDEVETYRRKVEECLPQVIELAVRQRVLVCADDNQIVNQLRFALSHSRMQIILHEDPSTLLSIIHSVQPDLLVVQQSMKYFDGVDLASVVRKVERFESLPILALLKESSEATLTRAIRGGVDGWLTIPFTAANVALSVLNHLRRAETARKLGGRDPLTGLYTKESMFDRIKGDLARVSRSGQQIGVLLVHLTDTDSPRLAFLEITKEANRVFRQSDILARYNEATLAVVLPGVDMTSIVSIVSRLRLRFDESYNVTLAATIAEGTITPETLLADVETRLTRVLGGAHDEAIGFLRTDPDKKPLEAPKILIADTDEAIVDLLRFFCAREGFDVDDVRTGTDVLQYLEEARAKDELPQVLLLESFLPGIDGFQILQQVHDQFGSRVAVIMLSVRPSEERVQKAFKLGATDFVAKPFRVPEIIARVRNGLIRASAV